MGPDLEKSKVEIGVLTRKDDVIVTRNEEDNLANCMSNFEDNNFHEAVSLNDGQANIPAGIENVEVDIVGYTKSDKNVQVEENRCGDSTESMSSFGNTSSENENGLPRGDMEVESRFCLDDSAWAFDDRGGEIPLRRKKLTDHWRRFIRPVSWRIKWLELHIKEFQSQVRKYDRQLAEYSQRRPIDFVEGTETKSLPFSSRTKRKKVVKRKKRKKVEETTDMKSYTLQHNLFSYYENKKSAGNCVLVNDDFSNLGKAISAANEFRSQEEFLSFDFKDDNMYENTLLKIELLQSRVRKMKARTEKVERENPGKFLLTMAETDMLTNSDQNPASPPESRGQTTVKSKTTKDVLSHGEVFPVPDLIERSSQPQVAVLGENASMNFSVKKEGVAEKPEQVIEKQSSEPEDGEMMPVGSTSAAAARVNFGGKTLPKNRSNITTYKRKRARRKSGNWSRKR